MTQTSREAAVFQARAYQLEMLEQSKKRNVIVAMDTGSGKTHMYVVVEIGSLSTSMLPFNRADYVPSAVLRIQYELNRCPPDQMVWFLAPTVTLCAQQHAVIQSQIPAVRTRLLIGSDNVDRWGEERIWRAALDRVRVVVSTHMVLLDALRHGFVKLQHLALLLFDEAHHCSRKHPANMIMQEFYHKNKSLGRFVPHILGLTASPILRSKISELSTIEANLDSVSITPRTQRAELMKHVHQPILRKLVCPAASPQNLSRSHALECLSSIVTGLPVNGAPTGLYEELASSKGSWTSQLVKFYNKAVRMHDQLGPWAVDYFVTESIALLNKSLSDNTFSLGSTHDKIRIQAALNQGPLPKLQCGPSLIDEQHLSPKVNLLISFLSKQDPQSCSCLLFVKERATVSVLYKILSTHTATRSKFKCGTLVGLSNAASRKTGVSELFDIKAQRETMAEFRAGEKNLIVSTDVLEEGIDVSACNLVICFDPPANVKSFIQRRGRARQERSTFAIMITGSDTEAKIQLWHTLEQELMLAYQSDQRLLKDVAALEDVEEAVNSVLTSSKGRLTADSAVGHLFHFCDKLPKDQFTETYPLFQFTEDPNTHLITCEVTLPNSVAVDLRKRCSAGQWQTERAAKKDAALQAYAALYHAGLLNENLLPLSKDWQEEETQDQDRDLVLEKQREKIAILLDVPQYFDAWLSLAKAWANPDFHETVITFHKNGQSDEIHEMILTTPADIPHIPPFEICYDDQTTFLIVSGKPRRRPPIPTEQLEQMRKITNILHRSTHSSSATQTSTDFVALITPPYETDGDLASWISAYAGELPIIDCLESHPNITFNGFIRNKFPGSPHVFRRWVAEDQFKVECVPFARRRNFAAPTPNLAVLIGKDGGLTERPQPQQRGMKKPAIFLASDCTVDRLPFAFAQLSLFLPTVLSHVADHVVARHLHETLLHTVPIGNLTHLATALTAPTSSPITNYQRLEFFGDSVLKLVVSANLFDANRTWPEAYLTTRRVSLVSNEHLAKVAVENGIGAFIKMDPATWRKWAPPLIAATLAAASLPAEAKTKGAPRKLLADVIESLIGAAYHDGGMSAARLCIHTLLPSIPPTMPTFDFSPVSSEQEVHYELVLDAQKLIGYTFGNMRLLAEAFTHGSYQRDENMESYQRLEYLGDAVLDMLVVEEILEAEKKLGIMLSPGAMTKIKAALVNGNLLGYLCMRLKMEQPTTIIAELSGTEEKRASSSPIDSTYLSNSASDAIPVPVPGPPHTVSLISFLLHASPAITAARQLSAQRCESLHSSIDDAIIDGQEYPWVLLCHLAPEKFHSDVVESIIGAIYVDSKGDMNACRGFLKRLGLVGWEYEEVGYRAENDTGPRDGAEENVEVDSRRPANLESQPTVNPIGHDDKIKQGRPRKSYLYRMVRGEVDVVHPKDKLQWSTGSKKIDYETIFVPADVSDATPPFFPTMVAPDTLPTTSVPTYLDARSSPPAHGGEKGALGLWSCKLKVDGEEIVEVSGCLTEEEGKVKAAEEGRKMMERRGEGWPKPEGWSQPQAQAGTLYDDEDMDTDGEEVETGSKSR